MNEPYKFSNVTKEYLATFYNILNNMIKGMTSVEMGSAYATNNINANFMREMIPHHRGAIRMSENALRYNICPELKPILDAIITSQQKGIEQMNQLLRCIT